MPYKTTTRAKKKAANFMMNKANSNGKAKVHLLRNKVKVKKVNKRK